MPKGFMETTEVVEAITTLHMMVNIFNAHIATMGIIHHM
jgi:hypothetical protein